MTEAYCRTCGQTVHITHDKSECSGEPDIRVPDELRKERVLRQENGQQVDERPDTF